MMTQLKLTCAWESFDIAWTLCVLCVFLAFKDLLPLALNFIGWVCIDYYNVMCLGQTLISLVNLRATVSLIMCQGNIKTSSVLPIGDLFPGIIWRNQ